MRRRTKTQDSLPSPKAAEKILYTRTKERNNNWGNRRMKGFKKAKPELQEKLYQVSRKWRQKVFENRGFTPT